MIDRAVKEFGRLDITYNNAGLGGAVGPIENITVEDWDRPSRCWCAASSWASSTRFRICANRAAARSSRPRRLQACRATTGLHAYSARKPRWSISRAQPLSSWAASNSCQLHLPGRHQHADFHRTPPALRQSLRSAREAQPITRGHPDDIANMALFLASDDSEWISGPAMVVDGAATAGGIATRQQLEQQVLPSAIVPPSGFSGPSFEG